MRRHGHKRLSLREAYYDVPPHVTVDDVVQRWVAGDKAYDDSMPVDVAVSDLLNYREYDWSRSHGRLDPDEWDALHDEIELHGWSKKKPVVVLVGKNGEAKVGEGNHRLAIARELGIDLAPTHFIFRQTVVRDDS